VNEHDGGTIVISALVGYQVLDVHLPLQTVVSVCIRDELPSDVERFAIVVHLSCGS
jgi:hypothetical protein